MATLQMIQNDLEVLNVVSDMLGTLYDVVMAESELTGHSIPASSILVYVAQHTRMMRETVNDVSEQMVADITPRLHFLREETEGD